MEMSMERFITKIQESNLLLLNGGVLSGVSLRPLMNAVDKKVMVTVQCRGFAEKKALRVFNGKFSGFDFSIDGATCRLSLYVEVAAGGKFELVFGVKDDVLLANFGSQKAETVDMLIL